MHYFVKAVPPRPSFTADMTDVERASMLEHAEYWRDLTTRGCALVFGLVFDPDGPFGVGMVEVETEEELQTIVRGDPATKAGVSIRVYPMSIGTARR